VVFTHEDVIRHELVAKIVAAYDNAARSLRSGGKD
jgi:phosphate starvation-inducible protein PhoH